MKFGVNLISFGPGASPESLSRWAAFAENVGYHFMSVCAVTARAPSRMRVISARTVASVAASSTSGMTR